MALQELELAPTTRIAGEPVDAYTVTATCPADGARLAHAASDEPTSNVRRAVAVCTECNALYRLTVTFLPLEGIGLR